MGQFGGPNGNGAHRCAFLNQIDNGGTDIDVNLGQAREHVLRQRHCDCARRSAVFARTSASLLLHGGMVTQAQAWIFYK